MIFRVFFEMAQAGGMGRMYDLTEVLRSSAFQTRKMNWARSLMRCKVNHGICGPSGEHQCGCCFNAKRICTPMRETGRDDQGRRRPDRISHDLGNGHRRKAQVPFPGNGAGTAGSRILGPYRGAGRAADPRRKYLPKPEQDEELQLWGRMVSILPWRDVSGSMYGLLFQETPARKSISGRSGSDKAQELQGMAQAFYTGSGLDQNRMRSEQDQIRIISEQDQTAKSLDKYHWVMYLLLN